MEHCVKVINPLSQDLGVMRQTLLFGGLESIAHNANRKMPDLKLFEFGNCYYYDAEKKSGIIGNSSTADNSKQVLSAYAEEYHLALWLTGKKVSGSWIHGEEESTIYEMKAYVMNILQRVGTSMGQLVFGEMKNNVFSKAITISNRGGKIIALYGIVSKQQTSKFDIQVPVYYADFDWNALMKLVRKSSVTYHDIPKFPSVSRDLALLIDKSVSFGQIEEIAYQSERKLLKDVKLFDVYEGKNLPEGKKSYAVNFILQDETRTLNDKAIDAIMNKIINNLKQKINAELR